MIILQVQLLPNQHELSVRDATESIATAMSTRDPLEHDSTYTTLIGYSGNANEGTVSVSLKQGALTDSQIDWLHLSSFSACYIDFYTVVAEGRTTTVE